MLNAPQAMLHTSKRFIGLDLYHAPQDLPEGYLTQCDNLYVDGGELVTRPGKQGQLATPFANPVYMLLAYRKPDGTTDVLVTSGGHLYHWPKGAPTAPEITVSGITAGSLASSRAMMARLGHFAYLVDGQGPLVRTDLATGQSVSGLSPLSAAIQAALTSSTLRDQHRAAQWSYDGGAASGQILPSYQAGGGQFASSGWTRFGRDPGMGPGFTQFFNMDEASEGARTGTLANPTLGGSSLYAKRFHFTMQWIKDSLGSNNYGGTATLTVYSDAGGTTSLGAATYSFNPQRGSDLIDHVFDFSAVTSDILSMQMTIQGQSQNDNGPNHFWINDASLTPQSVQVTFADGAAGGGVQVTTSETGAGLSRDLQGVSLYTDLGTPVDLSQINSIALKMTGADKWHGLALHFSVQQQGVSNWVAGNDLTLAADFTSAYVDISTIPASARTNVRFLRLTFVSNVTLTDGGAVLGIGPLVAGGNLSVGYADYYWVYTEVNSAGDITLVNIIESNPSPYSNSVHPLPDKATGQLSLPTAPLNGSSDYFNLYRIGGVFRDGLARLLTTRKWTDSFVYGSDAGQPSSAVRVNPYIAYDHASGNFTDNTPDSFLADTSIATAQYGRDPAPVGAQAVCAWQNRLWLAVGGRLYASWQVAQDQQAGLYFNRVNLAADPLERIKGATFAVGMDDNDPIQALIPIGTNEFFIKGFLVVLKQNSVWLVSGDSPDNFSIQSYLIGAGVGCIAPKAATLVGNRVWFRGANCDYQFDADVVDPKSVVLEKVLGRQSSPSEAFVYHARRLLHFAAPPGQTANSLAYVWDSRQEGWTRFLNMNVTSGLSLSTGTDTDNLFLGGLDGQIYEMTGSGDVATPGAAPAAVSFAVQSRAYGQEGAAENFWREKVAQRVFFSALAQEAATLTVGVQGVRVDGSPLAWSLGFNVTGSTVQPVSTAPRLKVSSAVRGRTLLASLSGSAVKPLRIVGLGLESTGGRVQD